MSFVEKVKEKMFDLFRRKEAPRKIDKRTLVKYRGPGFGINTFRMFLYIFLPVVGMSMVGTPYMYDRLYSSKLLYQSPEKEIEEKKRIKKVLTLAMVSQELKRLEEEEYLDAKKSKK